MTLKKGARITGAERAKLTAKWAKAYEKGSSIRDIAAAEGTSIGRVGNFLRESGVPLRNRGGATQSKKKSIDRAKNPRAVG